MSFEELKQVINAEWITQWKRACADADGHTHEMIASMEEYIRNL